MIFSRSIPIAALLIGLSVNHSAYATLLTVDASHSTVGFEISHLVVSTVPGSFSQFHGTIDYNEKEVTKSKVNFTVATDSINTANAKRDGHLKSEDFFDVKKYPEAKFVSTSITETGAKEGPKYKLEGDLTIHGETKKVSFDMNVLGKVKDHRGVEKTVFHATTVINRKDFKLAWNKPLEQGGYVLGETVKLNVSLETDPAAIPGKTVPSKPSETAKAQKDSA